MIRTVTPKVYSQISNTLALQFAIQAIAGEGKPLLKHFKEIKTVDKKTLEKGLD